MNKILVTGAMSFIGRDLVKRLAESESQIFATYKNINQEFKLTLTKKFKNIEWIQLDITKEDDYLKLPKNIDAIVHVAGISVDEKISIDDMLKTNVIGTRNLQKYALRASAKKFIYTSSLSIHGQIEESVINEKTPINNANAYGITKYLGERLLVETAGSIPTVAIRLPGVIGPGSHRAWIPTLVEKMKRNDEISIYNPNKYFNNAIHVSDLNIFIRNIINEIDSSGFMAFPVGASGKMTILEIVNMLKKDLKSKSKIIENVTLKSSFLIDSRFAENNFQYKAKNIELIIKKYAKEYLRTSTKQ